MNFPDLIKTTKDEGNEKHVPHLIIDKGHMSGKDIVRVNVGHDSPHPNTNEHHIAWIELYGVKTETQQLLNLGRAACIPVYSNPNVRFQINNVRKRGS